MWDTIKPLLSPCATGLPKKEERERKGEVFLKKLTENLPNLMKNTETN